MCWTWPRVRPETLSGVTLRIGRYELATPVVLAPMAGITNQAFRRLCREHAGPGGGIYVSEMVTSRALVERNAESLRLIAHDPDEHPRSVQLYGVDPETVGAAVRMLVEEDRADHIDLNFGCPVAQGDPQGWRCGAAVEVGTVRRHRAGRRCGPPAPAASRSRSRCARASTRSTSPSSRPAGSRRPRVPRRSRCTPARPPSYYSGTADWAAIARLKEAVTDIPVLGQRGHLVRRRRGADDAADRVRRSCGRAWLPRPTLAVRGSDGGLQR